MLPEVARLCCGGQDVGGLWSSRLKWGVPGRVAGEAALPGLVRAGPGCQGKPHTAPGPGNDAKLSGQQMTARTQASGKECGNGRG